MAQFTKRMLCKHKGMFYSSKTHVIKTLRMVAYTCNLSTGETETGGFLEPIDLICYASKFQTNEKPVSKRDGWSLESDTPGCTLTSPHLCSFTHRNTYLHQTWRNTAGRKYKPWEACSRPCCHTSASGHTWTAGFSHWLLLKSRGHSHVLY